MRLQKEQHKHDCRNHADIHSLHKVERLKHYGLHFCKYLGRLARSSEAVDVQPTLTDAFLVALSAANTLHQDLSRLTFPYKSLATKEAFYTFADAAGRFADACEKIDHIEEFVEMARAANRDIIVCIGSMALDLQFDLQKSIKDRRSQLRERAFYIED
ncbi:hypothetical protein GCM10008170_24910 [Methylopila capsulata]|uniref:Uncharacterized protein n=1 Tax=Methylopila capsulata TaxID=61654 RepID=A0A9W6MSP5_9HYPH|nr:hypothetical protein GCM10008170_24910 [Methylopila capsulata]